MPWAWIRPADVSVLDARPLLDIGCGDGQTVLAADLFHHLPDPELAAALGEIRAACLPGGRLVAWWYALPPDPARRTPDAPRFARAYAPVADMAASAGFDCRPLDI